MDEQAQLELDPLLDVTCTYIFDIFAVKRPKFRAKISDLGSPGGVAPKRGEVDLSGSNMYHHAKLHADRCHRRRDREPDGE